MSISKEQLAEQRSKISAFCSAARKNNVEVLKKLVDEVGVNTPFERGYTAVHYACGAGSMEALFFLLSRGGNLDQSPVDLTTRTPRSLLNQANTKILIDYFTAQATLREGGEKKNTEDQKTIKDREDYSHAAKKREEDNLPLNMNNKLLEAARYGDIKRIEDLLEQGANIKFKDENGTTALLLAATNGHRVAVNFLLSPRGGATFTEQNNAGWTALLLAARYGYTEMVKFLLSPQWGVSILDRNNDGNTALLLAATNGDTAMVEFLLSPYGGASITEKNNIGRTALLMAVSNYRTETVQFLLSPRGRANPTERDNDGFTALLLAAAKGSRETVEFLLSPHGRASITERTPKGDTALLLAALYGQTAMVEFLLNPRRGATITEKNNDGYTALLMAASNGHTETIQFLLSPRGGANITENIYGNTALLLAAQNGHTATVEFLLSPRGGANITERNLNGDTALLLAALNGHTVTVEFLLSLHGGASITERNNARWTALLVAAYNGYTETVKFLLSPRGGARITERNNNGDTALLLAAENGHIAMVGFLLSPQGHASITERNLDGDTALLLAVTNGHTTIVEFLLSAGGGASITERNNNGLSALDLALQTKVSYTTAICYSATIKELSTQLNKLSQEIETQEKLDSVNEKKGKESKSNEEMNQDKKHLASTLSEELVDLSKRALEHLVRLENEEKNVFFFRLGMLFRSFRLPHPVNPVGAYEMLIQVNPKTEAEYREANKCIYELLLNREVILTDSKSLSEDTRVPTLGNGIAALPMNHDYDINAELAKHLILSGKQNEPALGRFMGNCISSVGNGVRTFPGITGFNSSSMLALFNFIRASRHINLLEASNKSSIEVLEVHEKRAALPSLMCADRVKSANEMKSALDLISQMERLSSRLNKLSPELELLSNELIDLSKRALEHLTRLENKEKNTICYKLGIFFRSFRLPYPINPLGAYEMLIQVSSKSEIEYRIANQCIYELLLSREVILTDSKSSSENIRVPTLGNGAATSPMNNGYDINAELAKHLILSEEQDEPALGHFIADCVLGPEHSVRGFPGVTGFNPISMLNLFNFLRKQTQRTRKTTQERRGSLVI